MIAAIKSFVFPVISREKRAGDRPDLEAKFGHFLRIVLGLASWCTDFTKQNANSRVFQGVTPKESGFSEAKFSGGVVNFGKSQIEHMDGSISPLLPAEARLLRYLFEHPGQVVTRDDLVRDVWKLDPRGTSTRVMDVQIGKIRRKLRDSEGKLIETVRGQGYRLCL